MAAPDPAPRKHEGPPKWMRDVGAIGLGTTLALGMGVFTMLGFWVGRRMGHETAGILAGMGLGLFFCAYETWKVVRRSGQAPSDTREEGEQK